eukprot:m.210040 g.210040  ORF g.210040 m.210040 type:complete len:346 (-) comp17814_c0_seq8:1582-2619(-)
MKTHNKSAVQIKPARILTPPIYMHSRARLGLARRRRSVLVFGGRSEQACDRVLRLWHRHALHHHHTSRWGCDGRGCLCFLLVAHAKVVCVHIDVSVVVVFRIETQEYALPPLCRASRVARAVGHDDGQRVFARQVRPALQDLLEQRRVQVGQSRPLGRLRPALQLVADITLRRTQALGGLDKEVHDFLQHGESWAVCALHVPTELKELEDGKRAGVGLDETKTVGDLVLNLDVPCRRVWHDSVAEDLPGHDGVGPHVRLWREHHVVEALQSEPLDGQAQRVRQAEGVLAGFELAAQAKVGDLHAVVLRQQTVARGQIHVDEAVLGQVVHAAGNLLAEAELFQNCQ